MEKLKIGLLPLYIKLYDDSLSHMRPRIDQFHHILESEFEKRNVEVVSSQVCRIKQEFAASIAGFEKEDVDAIVTIHLAYSPSLESSDTLANTKLPLIILDTTPTFDYSPEQNPDELDYNHGIHGVQDMCNLLLRNGKEFLIEAGHWEESDVLDRVVSCVKAAKIAKNIRKARVGRFGNAFEGMGDFDLPEEILQSTIGIKTISYNSADGKKLFEQISDRAIDEEIELDKKVFSCSGIDEKVHRSSTRACLSMRKWIEENQLTAFTANFMEITGQSDITCMPFMEAGKAMSRGVGYAGEGDVLTAALVGALLSTFPETTFTEMFCPDWKNNTIFLSHMGEMNLSLAAEKPVLKEMEFSFTDADNPIVAYGRFKSGKAVFINLAPGKDYSYSLIASDIEMIDVNGEDKMTDSIHGWFRPKIQISDFLSQYSRHGGTHHAAIVYGDVMKAMEALAKIMNWKLVKI